MPKKTKKAKIIAEYRRKLREVTVQDVPHMREPTRTHLSDSQVRPVFELPSQLSPTTAPPASAVADASLTYIRKDLTKTLVLSALALSVEFVLYWKIG